jgi:hypothetical protein
VRVIGSSVLTSFSLGVTLERIERNLMAGKPLRDRV